MWCSESKISAPISCNRMWHTVVLNPSSDKSISDGTGKLICQRLGHCPMAEVVDCRQQISHPFYFRKRTYYIKMNVTEFLRCRRQHDRRSSVVPCCFGCLTMRTGLSPVGHIAAHEWPIISLLGFSQSIYYTRMCCIMEVM